MLLIVIPEILRELVKQQAALSSIKLCNKFYSASRAYARTFKLASISPSVWYNFCLTGKQRISFASKLR